MRNVSLYWLEVNIDNIIMFKPVLEQHKTTAIYIADTPVPIMLHGVSYDSFEKMFNEFIVNNESILTIETKIFANQGNDERLNF